MLNINDPRLQRLLEIWKPGYSTRLGYPERQVRAKDRSKYIALDKDNGPGSWTGVFLIDKETEVIYNIKGYGVINRKKPVGTLDEFLARLDTDCGC